jgi:regulation of enolase protein 1 (concanavalin A-like superfamily)
MRTQTTLQPGQRGAKKFADQYGDRLVCARYRQDEAQRKRFKTIELIVEEWPWTPAHTSDSPVLVKVTFAEKALRQQMKAAGGVWNPERQAWALPSHQVVALGLANRMLEDASCYI